MVKLNFPACEFRFKSDKVRSNAVKVFDIIRKSYVALTPEEWVRQHLLHYLVFHKHVPQTMIGVEKQHSINGRLKRTDVVVYQPSLQPLIVAECKAPYVEINQKVFDQAARYNLVFNAKYFVLTNGLQTICCRQNHQAQNYVFEPEIPDFKEIKES